MSAVNGSVYVSWELEYRVKLLEGLWLLLRQSIKKEVSSVMNPSYMTIFTIFLALKISIPGELTFLFPFLSCSFYLLLFTRFQILYTAPELPRVQAFLCPQMPLSTLTSKLKTDKGLGMGEKVEGGQKVTKSQL